MRWRLTSPHYLNVSGVEWNYNEVDRKTGKQVTRRFPVPSLLDPNNPQDWNIVSVRNQAGGPEEGQIIVGWEGKCLETDIIFKSSDWKGHGAPTPDMVPLDDEAKAESAKYLKQWNMPTDGSPIPDNSSELILNRLQAEFKTVSEAQNKPQQIEGLTEMLAAMTAIMKQNQELIALMAKPQVAVEQPATARRA